jgi:aspartyl-tRNA(Asn)/glutamyl-tRNA(Gln) amidotransferase subunit A
MDTVETITAIAQRLRRKEISPVELTRGCLYRIEKLNPLLNAFITVTAETALKEARQAEDEITRGHWRGPLHGVPVALKDLIDTAGVLTTAASEVYKDRIPTKDAEVVRRLRRAGAVFLGKNNLHEFAYGGSSLVGSYGEVHNPRNTAHIAGGSSGGSAAAVAAGLCYASIGTDTAGSIRLPAALCGCVGLKPTYGRVSTRGVIPLSWSLDHVGPLTACVSDAALVLQAIAGYDALDVASAEVPVEDYVSGLRESTKTVRVGVPREHFFDDLDEEVKVAVEAALRVISSLVAEMRDMKVDVPTDRAVQLTESYAYHAENVTRAPEAYQPETLRRIRAGEKIATPEYILRRREMDEARRTARDFFADVDLLVIPTTPMPAPAIADLKRDPQALRPAELRLLRNTRPFNVWGLPAVSLPCGVTKTGLPIGLQIAGASWHEAMVLSLAWAYENTVSRRQ